MRGTWAAEGIAKGVQREFPLERGAERKIVELKVGGHPFGLEVKIERIPESTERGGDRGF